MADEKKVKEKKVVDAPREKLPAALLAFLPSGGVGAMDFYLGKESTGQIKFWVGVISLGLHFLLYIPMVIVPLFPIFMFLSWILMVPFYGMWIWSIVEGILVLAGKTTVDAYGKEIVATGAEKSRYAAVMLGRWAGFGGVHNFYLGNMRNGLIQAIVSGICLTASFIPCVGLVIFLGLVGMEIWAINEAKAIEEGKVNADDKGTALKA